MNFTIASPVFLPCTSFSKPIPLLGDLFIELPCHFPTRVTFVEFGVAAPKFNIFEYRRKRVVVPNCDWIKFVVVAACTPDCYTKRRGTNSLKDLVQTICSCLSASRRFLPNSCDRNMRSRNQVASGISVPNHITSDLLSEEFVVGFVFVKCSDDVITIDPGIFSIHVTFGAICFSPADHVEPVLCPSFTKVG